MHKVQGKHNVSFTLVWLLYQAGVYPQYSLSFFTCEKKFTDATTTDTVYTYSAWYKHTHLHFVAFSHDTWCVYSIYWPEILAMNLAGYVFVSAYVRESLALGSLSWAT